MSLPLDIFRVLENQHRKRSAPNKKGGPVGRPCVILFPPLLLDPLHRLDDLLLVAESAESEVTFTGRPEARTRGANHMALAEQFVEEVPAGQPTGSLQPDVGCVDAAEAGDAGGREPLADDAGVVHVVVDDRFGLPPTLRGVDRGGGLLHRVGGSVEFGGGATVPELVEAVFLTR